MIRASTLSILFSAVVLAAGCSLLEETDTDKTDESSGQTTTQPSDSSAGAQPLGSIDDPTPKSTTTEPKFDWKLYTSEEGRYQAEFPGDPVEQTFPPPAGTNLEIKGVLLEVNNKLALLTSYFDVPAGTPVDMDAALAGAAKGGVGGEITSVEDRTVSGNPCKYGVSTGTSSGQDANLKVLGCQASNRVYTAQIISINNEPFTDEEANRFFNSIAFT